MDLVLKHRPEIPHIRQAKPSPAKFNAFAHARHQSCLACPHYDAIPELCALRPGCLACFRAWTDAKCPISRW